MVNESIDNREGIARDLNNIGAVYYSMNNFEKAMEFLVEALRISEEIDDPAGKAASLNNMGNTSLYRSGIRQWRCTKRPFRLIVIKETYRKRQSTSVILARFTKAKESFKQPSGITERL
ncbi:MAG: tetratricopeptide repeat protein [Thermodesulfobacteriota bacterium]|nr:tetratricopeptide repeat protein [Thermodesulfobacteriota bacterium]